MPKSLQRPRNRDNEYVLLFRKRITAQYYCTNLLPIQAKGLISAADSFRS